MTPIERDREVYAVPEEAALFLRVCSKTLTNWRCKPNKGPTFSKFDGRVYYRWKDLFEYKDSQFNNNASIR